MRWMTAAPDGRSARAENSATAGVAAQMFDGYQPTDPRHLQWRRGAPVGPLHHTALVLDLVLPLHCGGCGAPGTRWCEACEAAVHPDADAPRLITPRIDAGVPVFTLGRYAGPRRSAVVELKEHGRTDLVAPLARALALGIHRLLAWGIVDTPLTLVPAPTRWWVTRRRGGDPVSKVATAAAAGHAGIAVVAALRTRAWTRDSVGLDIAHRQRNLAGRVVFTNRPLHGDVLVVDDVVTTGSTAAESVRVLRTHGFAVTGVLAIAYA